MVLDDLRQWSVVSDQLGVADAADALVESPLVPLGGLPPLASGPLQQQAVPKECA